MDDSWDGACGELAGAPVAQAGGAAVPPVGRYELLTDLQVWVGGWRLPRGWCLLSCSCVWGGGCGGVWGGGGRGLCLLPYFRAACKGGA